MVWVYWDLIHVIKLRVFIVLTFSNIVFYPFSLYFFRPILVGPPHKGGLFFIPAFCPFSL